MLVASATPWKHRHMHVTPPQHPESIRPSASRSKILPRHQHQLQPGPRGLGSPSPALSPSSGGVRLPPVTGRCRAACFCHSATPAPPVPHVRLPSANTTTCRGSRSTFTREQQPWGQGLPHRRASSRGLAHSSGLALRSHGNLLRNKDSWGPYRGGKSISIIFSFNHTVTSHEETRILT